QQMIINKVFRGSPAARAGIRKGDLLVAVNGKEVTNSKDAGKAFAGKKNAEVKLQILRGGEKLTFKMTRQIVDFEPLQTRLTKDGIGYLRFPKFGEGIDKKVRNAISRLKERNKGGLKGLVLDLRGNPGGFVSETLKILDDFVKEGTLMTQKGRGGKVDKVYVADPKHTRYADLPLAVLIDKNSASASELVAGVLRDHKRAVLLGEKSYGKGSVQPWTPLVDGSGFVYTTHHYYLPGGTTPHEKGITPDISLSQAKAQFKQANPADRRRIVDYIYEAALLQLRKN
ncbi:MAG: S41 family peptidase, partial [Pseudomonadota bacterium]